jgi:hypothetical protein
MKNLIILGNGLAALIYAAYNIDKNVIIIGNKIGGQMSNEISLGPRIIQSDNYTKNFIKNFLLLDDVKIKKTFIKYKYNDKFLKNPTPEFRNKYSIITRDKDTASDYTMSQNKNEIEYFDIKYNIFINILYQKLLTYNNIQFINGDIIKITSDYVELKDSRKIYTKNSEKVNTIPLYIFKKLINMDYLELNSKPVYFYYKKNKKFVNNFYYVYQVNDFKVVPHRITYYDDNIIEESIKKISDNYIAIIPKIINETPFDSIGDWKMFGRFAEWDQSIKINEMLKKLENSND